MFNIYLWLLEKHFSSCQNTLSHTHTYSHTAYKNKRDQLNLLFSCTYWGVSVCRTASIYILTSVDVLHSQWVAGKSIWFFKEGIELRTQWSQQRALTFILGIFILIYLYVIDIKKTLATKAAVGSKVYVKNTQRKANFYIIMDSHTAVARRYLAAHWTWPWLLIFTCVCKPPTQLKAAWFLHGRQQTQYTLSFLLAAHLFPKTCFSARIFKWDENISEDEKHLKSAPSDGIYISVFKSAFSLPFSGHKPIWV